MTDPSDKTKNQNLRRRYGISKCAYDSMLKGQEFKCKVCEFPHSKEKPLQVDHEHSTGIIRGLLCQYCNLILGQAKDSSETLVKASEYLKRHNSKRGRHEDS